jgi:hypothetical protein
MALNMPSGFVYSAPRIIETRDTRAGCPGAAAAGDTLIAQTFTVNNPAVYWTHGRIIFNATSAGKTRADFILRVNGADAKYALDTAITSAGGLATWEELDATFMGTLAAGTHTLTMVASNASNCWGCGSEWGQLVTLVWEAA